MNCYIYKIPAIAAAAVLLFGSCDSQKELAGNNSYSDAEYIMFADTMAVYAVQQDNGWFKVPVVSTVTRDYDRTIGVEIIDRGSNAIERRHYNLRSNTLTIKAGETRADVEVQGVYQNIEASDSLGFVLGLVIPDQKQMPLYPNSTKVVMQKVCPYELQNFTGYCMVTSLFLYYYSPYGVYQRLCRTEAHPTEPDTVILHDFLYDGYDITIKFDPSEPLEMTVEMDEDQMLVDEFTAFGIARGDNKVLCSTTPVYPSYFNTCENYVELMLRVYVQNMGEPVGEVGIFYNVLEWVSNEEGERLKNEYGL